MLKTTQQEREHVMGYMTDQAPDETVQLAQKVYSEQVHAVTHDIWDVHTDRGRWWVITHPTNLYCQEQFPNMDLALTFHIGLCLRMPRGEEHSLTELPIEPLLACWRTLEEANKALRHAEEVEEFQAVGVRCRESLITLGHVAQELIHLPDAQARPKRSDFRAWSDRRFANWLTHARVAHFNDAEAAVSSTEFTISLFTTVLIRYVRGVPDRCPACGSQRLSPERGVHSSAPNTLDERPVCGTCGWTGTPVIVGPSPTQPDRPPPKGECVVMTPPLRNFPRRGTGRKQT
jgi:hypothetical protein